MRCCYFSGQVHGLFPAVPPDFAGLGVLDWEAWPFTWERWVLAGEEPKTNHAMNASVELVRSQHPSWNSSRLEAEAARQYDAAMQQFITATLDALHRLRPNARFGFYTEPCPWWAVVKSSGDGSPTPMGCRADFQALHDEKEAWLWEATDAVFAQIYTVRPPGTYPNPPHAPVNVTADSNRRYVDAQMSEAMRVTKGRRAQVFAYARAMYSTRADKDTTKGHYNASAFIDHRDDLLNEVARPAMHGAAGTVIWGSSDDCMDASLCQGTASYVRRQLGPMSAAAIQASAQCSQKHCGGTGRCLQLDKFGGKLAKPACVKTDDSQIAVPVQPDGSYSVVVDGVEWLPSGATFVRHSNTTWSTHDKSLQLSAVSSARGTDGGGAFNRTLLTWKAGNRQFETSVRVYDRMAVFRQTFVEQLEGTDASSKAKDGVASGWPAFRMTELPVGGRRGVVSFQGQMAGMDTATGAWGAGSGVVGEGIDGTGPLAIFEEGMARTVVVSAHSNFVAASQSIQDSPPHPSGASVISYGVMGSVNQIPAGFVLETVVVASASGPNDAMIAWGDVLLREHGKDRYAYRDDTVMQKLGYSTGESPGYR